jgi:hypothetical protein
MLKKLSRVELFINSIKRRKHFKNVRFVLFTHTFNFPKRATSSKSELFSNIAKYIFNKQDGKFCFYYNDVYKSDRKLIFIYHSKTGQSVTVAILPLNNIKSRLLKERIFFNSLEDINNIVDVINKGRQDQFKLVLSDAQKEKLLLPVR